jgi:hypothetical protein
MSHLRGLARMKSLQNTSRQPCKSRHGNERFPATAKNFKICSPGERWFFTLQNRHERVGSELILDSSSFWSTSVLCGVQYWLRPATFEWPPSCLIVGWALASSPCRDLMGWAWCLRQREHSGILPGHSDCLMWFFGVLFRTRISVVGFDPGNFTRTFDCWHALTPSLVDSAAAFCESCPRGGPRAVHVPSSQYRHRGEVTPREFGRRQLARCGITENIPLEQERRIRNIQFTNNSFRSFHCKVQNN